MTARLIALAAGLVIGMQAATQFTAWSFAYAPALGPGLPIGEDVRLYPPWSLITWRIRFGEEARQTLSSAMTLVFLGGAMSLGCAALLAGEGRSRRNRGWGGLRDARAAGLLASGGCVLGEFQGRLLMTSDLRPTLVTGGTRSGKGRGHVVPSLLSWTASALVHDPKGELWRLTAGWRTTFSHTLRFAPRDLQSVRWNPLAEIRPGPSELAQVQRLASILSDPAGTRDDEAIWDKSACEILEALILHVLYVAKDGDKTLLQVRDLLADLDGAAETMRRTLHRMGPGGAPETHPFIKTAVTGYAAMHDRFRTSVQGTARSYLKWLAGEDIERALSTSDFALGDLMCADAPMTLYVEVAPADAAPLRPLVRLLLQAAVQSLTTHEATGADGRAKQHPLLMVMDEFPLLGRLEFFGKSLRLMSGYRIKALLVAQSLNDIAESYGASNGIIDNCHVYTAFSTLDPLTQDKVSKLTGSVSEARISRSRPAGLAGGHASISRAEVDKPLLEAGDVRGLAQNLQLTFIAGHRPLKTRKVRYDKRRPFRQRAQLHPPRTSPPDAPRAPLHPWAGRRALGEDRNATLPLFKEAAAAMDDRKTAAKVAEIYERVAGEMAAEEAALDHLQGRRS